ncbi:MAG: type II toxin-antitoxin system RelE/ParE family toxin [bacterium]
MAHNIVFTNESLEDLDRLDKKVINRIIKKLKWFVKQSEPINFAKRLKYDAIGQYRFRIGDYRVIFDNEKDKIKILRIGHRSSIYK